MVHGDNIIVPEERWDTQIVGVKYCTFYIGFLHRTHRVDIDLPIGSLDDA